MILDTAGRQLSEQKTDEQAEEAVRGYLSGSREDFAAANIEIVKNSRAR